MDSRQTNPTVGSGAASPAKAHRAALPVGQVAATARASAEQWYFRIDGREYGPTSRDQLEKFLAPPRLCKSLEVMCSNREGHWFLIGKHETVEMVLEKFGIVVEADPEVVSSKSNSQKLRGVAEEVSDTGPARPVYTKPNPLIEWFSETFEAACELASKNILWISLAFGVVAINVALLYIFADGSLADREVLTRYESMWNTAVKMEADKSSEEAWRTYADESQRELDRFIKQLSRSASVQNPVRQQLLFVARDVLKPVFDATEPPPKNSPTRRVIQQYFKLLTKQLPATP